ncbi:hypothetical protein [Allopusillimonas ginsengisoli]|uniref:hypothetical protein n=1 Tax=Allopusillimonas ginsengisoli TaxID=453575 RepID=UPI00101FE89A|nr:hypothetical protein [Allopusillimonas ginsengisoli]TEA77344.1 hypothetical protein ERE07_15465 [Allopusillimonas ginsengisoli]
MTEALVLQVGKVSLVLGLEWFALLDEGGARAARRLARRHRATHMIAIGHAAGAVGVVTLPQHRGRNHTRVSRNAKPAPAPSDSILHSAAMLFARQFPTGTVAALIEVSPGLLWLIAVHEGVVVARTDRLYVDAAAALAAMAELKLAYPHLVTPGEGAVPAVPGLDALTQHTGAHSQLLYLSNWRQMSISTQLGLGLMFILVFCAARLNAGSYQMDPLSHKEPATSWLTPSSDAMLPTASPVVHGITGLQSLLGIFHALPTNPGGWALTWSQCQAHALSWHCVARYRRERAEATNEALLQHAPSAWRISFVSLDEATADWQTDAPGILLQHARPMSPVHNDRHLLSALQGLQALFTHLQVGQPMPVASVSTHSSPAQAAGDLASQFRQRAIRIEGPLRSASLLVDHAAFMGWSTAMLRVQAIDAPDTKRSRFLLTLEGELYESKHAIESR